MADAKYATRYNIRVKLKPEETGSCKKPSKETTANSAKEYYKEYRRRLKEDKNRYSEFKRLDSLQKKAYRKSLEGEKLEHYREKAKMRMRAYRQRLKEKGIVEKKPATRKLITKMREYWRQKKREQRGKMSDEDKARQKEKRREKYRSSKRKLNFNIQPIQPNTNTPEKASPYIPRPPEKFAARIKQIVDHATPRKKKALIKTGLFPSAEAKAKMETNSKIVARVKRALAHLKRQKTKEKKKQYHLLTRTLVGKYAVEHCLRKALDIKWEHWVRMSEIEKYGPDDAKRIDAFSEETVEHIERFYEYESVTLPMKRTVSGKTLKQKRVLTETLAQVHRLFLQDYPKLKVSLSHFRKLRPKEVLTVKQQKFASCLCEYCLNVQFKIDVINRAVKTHGLDNSIESKYHAVNISLCDKQNEEFHDRECAERECGACGTQKLESYLKPLLDADRDADTVYTWKRWQLGTVRSSAGKEVKRQVLAELSGTLSELIEEFPEEIDFLSNHIFVARWQYKQFNNLSKTVPEGVLVTIADYAENYRCMHQDEIQSAYYSYNQVTLFPMIAYYRCPDCQTSVVQESAVFVSPDMTKDASAVDQFSKKMVEHIQGHVHVSKEVQFSDGSSSQFKSKVPFLNLSKTTTHSMERAFFGSRHGKSPCDALGGLVKKQAELHVKSRRGIIQDAKQFFEFCREKLTIHEGSECEHKKRVFFYEDNIKREKPDKKLETIDGTRKLHSIRGIVSGMVKFRHLSCFCNVCLGEEKGNCQNEKYVGEWEIHSLFRGDNKGKHQSKQKGGKRSKKDTENEVGKKNKSQAGSKVGKKDKSQAESKVGKKNKSQTENKGGNKEKTENKDGKKSQTEQSKGKQLFVKDQLNISACSTIEDLRYVAGKKRFKPLPQYKTKTFCNTAKTVDKNSMTLLPADTPKGLHPAIIQGDGNCLPRSASLIAYGSEDHYQEMRDRIVCDIVNNEDLYLDNKYLRSGMNPKGHFDVAKTFASYSSMYMGTRLDEKSIRELYEQETLSVSKNGTYMGMWQLASLANILSRPVVSVYPQYGSHTVRNDMHRVFFPGKQEVCEKEPVYIMWTNIHGAMAPEREFSVNHFVVLMPLTSETNIDLDCSFEMDSSMNVEDDTMIDDILDAIHCLDVDMEVSKDTTQDGSEEASNATSVLCGDDGQTVTGETSHEGRELVNPAVEAHDQIVSLVEDMVHPGDDGQTVTKVTCQEECEVDPKQESLEAHDQIVSLVEDMVPPGDDGQTVTRVTGHEGSELVDPEREAVEAHDQIVSLFEDMVPLGDDGQTVTIVTGHEGLELVDPDREAVEAHDQIVSMVEDMVPPGDDGQTVTIVTGHEGLELVYPEREAVEAHDQIVSLVEDMVPPGDDRQTVTKVTGHEECEVDPEQEAVWTHDQIVSLGDDMVPPGDDGQTVTKVTGQEECEVDPKQEAVEAHDQIVSLVEDMVPPGDDRQTVTIVTGHEECEVDPEQEAVGTHDQIVSLGDDMVPPGYNPGEYILTKYGRSSLPAVVDEWPWVSFFKKYGKNTWVMNEVKHTIIASDVERRLQPPDVSNLRRCVVYTFDSD